jgi:hypothetical protein
VLEQKEMEKLGMGCFLAVARGSRQPPKLIVLEYQGGSATRRPWRSSARASRSTPAASRSSPRRDGRDEVRHVRRGERPGRDEGGWRS